MHELCYKSPLTTVSLFRTVIFPSSNIDLRY